MIGSMETGGCLRTAFRATKALPSKTALYQKIDGEGLRSEASRSVAQRSGGGHLEFLSDFFSMATTKACLGGRVG